MIRGRKQERTRVMQGNDVVRLRQSGTEWGQNFRVAYTVSRILAYVTWSFRTVRRGSLWSCERGTQTTRHRDCHIHYVNLILDDSNETKEKFLFQVYAIISNESNEAGLSAQNWLFCSNVSIEASCLNWESVLQVHWPTLCKMRCRTGCNVI